MTLAKKNIVFESMAIALHIQAQVPAPEPVLVNTDAAVKGQGNDKQDAWAASSHHIITGGTIQMTPFYVSSQEYSSPPLIQGAFIPRSPVASTEPYIHYFLN